MSSLGKIWFTVRSKLFGKPSPTVAVLRFQGVIGADGPMKNAINMNAYAGHISKAFKTPGIAAVALQINSPGGSPVQSGLIMDRIRQMASEKDIPVLAFAEDVAASGGYMLSLAADEIFAHEVSIVGSIGVISAGFGFPKLMEKYGVERRLYTAGESKAMLDPFSKENDKDIERIKEIQKEVHEYFKSIVRDRRGKRLKSPRGKIFSGDVFTGKEAIKLGLIDDIGDMRTVLRERFGTKVKLKLFEEKKPKLSKLLSLGSQSNTNIAGDITKSALSTIEERFIWNRFGL